MSGPFTASTVATTAADAIKPGQRRIGQEGLDERRRIGEPRRLDHDVIEARNLAVLARVIEIVQRGDEIAEHGAAQAAVLQHHDGVVALRGEHVIEADLAELVDHHRRVGHRRIAQRAIEQRGLAAAQKAGEDGDGRVRDVTSNVSAECGVLKTPRSPASRRRSGGRRGSW